MERNNHSEGRSIKKWENLIPLLWCEVSEVLKICLRDMESNDGILTLSVDDPVILDLYEDYSFNTKKILAKKNTQKQSSLPIDNPYLPHNAQTDKHLQSGLSETHRDRKKEYPRLAELTINACKKAIKSTKYRDAIVIPSPLYIIYSFLTDPDNPCTAAYALTACRNWLSRLLLVSPVISSQRDKDLESVISYLTEEDLRSSMESFSNYARIGMRWPGNKSNKSITPIKHAFVGGYLATRGFSLLWFSRKKGKSTVSVTASPNPPIFAAG